MRCACIVAYSPEKNEPVRNGEEVGGGNMIEKQSGNLEHVEELWDAWEIQCLMLVSLSLQVFLFLAADLRRHSASRPLRTVLWLAYLSADIVAVFALGHLAVHAQGRSHELVLFWAPFLLVHLGGQDNITAFSKEDNELWTRHLLNLLTQAAVAGYVLSKSSWPDARLRAAMLLMFLCGFLKYAGRTYCLYSASTRSLRARSLISLSDTILRLRREQTELEQAELESEDRMNYIKKKFLGKFYLSESDPFVEGADDIMSVDAPVNGVETITVADLLPSMQQELESIRDGRMAYHNVAACLVKSYRYLYTKAPLAHSLALAVEIYDFCEMLSCICIHWAVAMILAISLWVLIILTYSLFYSISGVIALLLFAAAEKEGHHSKVDIAVSYILLAGAIVLDLLPALTSIASYAREPLRPRTAADCACMCLTSCDQPTGWRTRKQWSEEVAQYSMIKRYTSSVPSLVRWIDTRLGARWCLEFLELTRTRVTDDLKLLVLDKLFMEAWSKNWDFASFHGERALGMWMDRHDWHQVFPESERSDCALHKSVNSKVDFPTSVLIWHIATDICYFTEDKVPDTEPDEIKKTMMSRELSHYIMYLVFKCDVMLTSSSRLVHQKAHEGLKDLLSAGQRSPGINIGEKQAAIQVFEGMKKEAMEKDAEQRQGSQPGVQAQGNKNEGSANKDDATTSTSSRVKELLQSTEEALYSPVLPRVYAVAQELIDIYGNAERWDLILEVWLEMLFYTAPRCGAAFHYEHLSTGGEFITHVLLLMRNLGPFLPKPGA